jgi:hypothetical protein
MLWFLIDFFILDISLNLSLQEFEVADAFDIAKILQLQQVAVSKSGRQFNKIFIDLNGSRDIAVVYACLEKLQRALRPELIVVKSVKMKALILQCTAFETPFETESESQDIGEISDAVAQSMDSFVASSFQHLSLPGESLGM